MNNNININNNNKNKTSFPGCHEVQQYHQQQQQDKLSWMPG
jgi:hypothetical protein